MFPFACDSCGALYSVERKRLGPSGFRIRCGQCGAAIAVTPDTPPPSSSSRTSATDGEPLPAASRPSFDQCISWLRILMETPPRPSINTMKEPWEFAPPCSPTAVAEFESTYGIKLPHDYVRFITEVGNGTAKGGAFSVFPLGMTVQDDGYGPRIPYRPSVSDALSRTFQHWARDLVRR